MRAGESVHFARCRCPLFLVRYHIIAVSLPLAVALHSPSPPPPHRAELLQSPSAAHHSFQLASLAAQWSELWGNVQHQILGQIFISIL